MKVIGAGLSKTGTKSLAAALRYLGYSVYDLDENWFYHSEVYSDAFQGNMPDFAEMYKNIDATTDMPPCLFFDEIFTAFPDSKVVLSVRDDEETWRKSIEKTNNIIIPAIYHWSLIIQRWITPTGRAWNRLNKYLAVRATKLNYTEHNTRVMSTIPSSQLLVFNVKEGWEPLCQFLDKDIPDIPFPRLNVNSEAVRDMVPRSAVVKQMTKELMLMVTLIVLVIALLYTTFICR